MQLQAIKLFRRFDSIVRLKLYSTNRSMMTPVLALLKISNRVGV